jgi:hypothetical protein
MDKRYSDVPFPPDIQKRNHCHQKSAWCQHAMNLINHQTQVLDVLEDLIANNQVKKSVLERDAGIPNFLYPASEQAFGSKEISPFRICPVKDIGSIKLQTHRPSLHNHLSLATSVIEDASSGIAMAHTGSEFQQVLVVDMHFISLHSVCSTLGMKVIPEKHPNSRFDRTPGASGRV